MPFHPYQWPDRRSAVAALSSWQLLRPAPRLLRFPQTASPAQRGRSGQTLPPRPCFSRILACLHLQCGSCVPPISLNLLLANTATSYRQSHFLQALRAGGPGLAPSPSGLEHSCSARLAVLRFSADQGKLNTAANRQPCQQNSCAAPSPWPWKMSARVVAALSAP